MTEECLSANMDLSGKSFVSHIRNEIRKFSSVVQLPDLSFLCNTIFSLYNIDEISNKIRTV